MAIGDGGGFTNVKAELFVLALADGFVQTEAWKMAGGENGSTSGRTKARLLTEAQFKARLEMLVEKKSELVARGPDGEALWVAEQTWRVARASGDVGAVVRAAELVAKVAERLGGGGAGGKSEEVAPAGDGPGRPAQTPSRTRVDIGGLRRKLQDMGVEVPAAAEVEG